MTVGELREVLARHADDDAVQVATSYVFYEDVVTEEWGDGIRLVGIDDTRTAR